MTYKVAHVIVNNKIKASAIMKLIYHISLDIEHKIARGRHKPEITLIFSHLFVSI